MSTKILNSGNIMKLVYEPSQEALRVNIVGGGSPSMPNVVRLTDGTGYITSTVSGPYRALDVNIINDLEVILNHTDDSVRLGDGTNFITSTTSGAKTGVDVAIIDGGLPTAPTIANPVTTLADTEYSYTFPANTKKFRINSRNNAKLQIAFNSGDTNTIFKTVYAGSTYIEEGLKLTGTIYFRSNKAGEIVEIISWI